MEWQEQGRKKEQRRSLLQVLQRRFPGAVPADLAAAIAELDDSDELVRWLDEAVTAPSLDAFRSSIGR
jgi:hypothetical protein